MFNLYVLELNNFETLLMKQIIPRGSTCLSQCNCFRSRNGKQSGKGYERNRK